MLYEYINNKRNIEYYLFNKIPIIIKEYNNINIKYIISKIEKTIPQEFVENLDMIYFGEFSFLDKENLYALYKDNTIYISSKCNDNQIILSTIHEIGHCVEEEKTYDLYADKQLKKEFLSKRLAFYENLKNNQYTLAPINLFLGLEQDEMFMNYLYDDLGTKVLYYQSLNLFLSPYSLTSLREYFAIGFEYFFGIRGDEIENIKNICPVLYSKLNELIEDK